MLSLIRVSQFFGAVFIYDSRTLSDSLLVAASRELKGKARRVFVAKVCQSLCGGSSRKAEARFGWGRAMVARGLEELDPAHPTLPCTPALNFSKE